jgi:hypothetical protein
VSEATCVTIRDIHFHHLTSAIEGEDPVPEDASTNVLVEDVTGSILSKYGVYANDARSRITVRNCQFIDTRFHGIRLYGDNLTVENCSVYGEIGTSVWIVHEQYPTSWARVTRIAGQQRIRLGPDHGTTGTYDGARRHDIHAHDLQSTDHVRIEMGVIGGCFVNICSHLTVGRLSSEIPIEEDRPMIDVNWDSVLDPTPDPPPNPHVTIIANLNMEDVFAIQYDYCFADIGGDALQPNMPDGEVGIDDLLEVISGWGTCASAPSGFNGPPPPCPGDIAPVICGDYVVNIDDLLMVISEWGPCNHPECGANDPVVGGAPEAPPETVDDCWDKADAAYPGGGIRWLAVLNACLQALEETGNGNP